MSSYLFPNFRLLSNVITLLYISELLVLVSVCNRAQRAADMGIVFGVGSAGGSLFLSGCGSANSFSD